MSKGLSVCALCLCVCVCVCVFKWGVAIKKESVSVCYECIEFERHVSVVLWIGI